MSIKNQVSNYKAAVGKRNVGSDPSSSSMARASDTAIGRNRSSSVTTNVSTSTSPRSRTTRGSWEGYMHAPSTVIQMNGTGYLSKASQKARNSTRGGYNLTSTRQSLGASNQMSLKPFDYTYSGSAGNSYHLLKDHMQLNDLFKG